MSYQVIARKWRPQAVDEVTGQEHITRTLRNALEYDRLHHAYLFSGARGVGKTTTARLLSKALNCRKTEKPNLQPCSVNDPDPCVSCIEISESRSLDVLEIDAASHTGIDDVRDTIIENITVNPARDRYKVFIIDEVHQLSKPAFNALLKTLEEPPRNVVFIMATTELHKVPDTILSRCQQFEFRTISIQKIFERLRLIADAEKINVSDEALREIARSGEGSMRDAQSNFDQVISFSGETISVEDVTSALGMASSEMLTKMVAAIADESPKTAIDIVADLTSRGQDYRNFCRDLLALFRDLLVFKIAGESDTVVEGSILGRSEMQRFAALFSESDLVRFFNSLAETENKLKDAANSRFTLEIGLVRLIEMRRVASLESIIERLAKLEQPPASNAVKEKSDAASATPFPEKKTLISDPPPEPEFIPQDEPSDISETPDILPDPPKPKIDLSFIDSMPIKLPPIDSEALEHVEDTWLDNAYEEKLARGDDSLTPIPNAAQFAEMLGAGDAKIPAAASANGSTPVARSNENPAFDPPVFDDQETDAHMPSLGENPTDEDLREFAASHPTVKRAMRIFRAQIVDVKKR